MLTRQVLHTKCAASRSNGDQPGHNRRMENTLSVEEVLRVITEKAAVMRFLSDSGSYADYQAPDGGVLRGLSALSTDIEELTQRVKRALTSPVLETPLPSLVTPVAAVRPRRALSRVRGR
jgi:hypothetical protein